MRAASCVLLSAAAAATAARVAVVIPPRALPSGAAAWESVCVGSREAPPPASLSCNASCGIELRDGFATAAEMATLRAMTDRAARWRSDNWAAGPTLVDFRSGVYRGSRRVGWLANATTTTHRGKRMRVKPLVVSDAERATYNAVFGRIRDAAATAFACPSLAFTHPTFVTRIAGDPEWQPAHVHDAYDQTHVDRANTPHYAVSGILYLTTAGEDFTGGDLLMWHPAAAVALDAAGGAGVAGEEEGEEGGDDPDAQVPHGPLRLRVAPLAGRLLLFTSGHEHPHRVTRVASGTRTTFSMWFTCDPARALNHTLPAGDGSGA